MAQQETQRQLKVSRLLQKDLSEIFQRELPHLFGNTFVTITSVRVSPDFGVASIYLSFMLAKDVNGLMELIEENNKPIRSLLAAKIRHQIRTIPVLRFFYDDTPDEAMRMHKLLASLNIPKEGEDKKTADSE
jgi:ribosome-binding factor A